MFDNVGGKIKGVARFVTWLGIIASVIGFFILVVSDTIMLAFAVLIVGCVVSWLSSLTLYGFGQLVENSDSMVRMNVNISNPENEDSKENTINYFSTSLHQSLTNTELSENQINEVLKLKKMKDSGSLSDSDCRKKVYKVISDLSIDKVMKILNNL